MSGNTKPFAKRFVFTLVAALAALTGCDDPQKADAGGTTTKKIEARNTINSFTQEVMKLEDALAQGGTIAEGGGDVGPSGGYLGTVTKARRSALATISQGQIKQALEIYDIQNNGPVKTYEEFMANIIKKDQPDGIRLPTLPYYQEYAYDEQNRELVVVEFPEKKKQFEAQNK